MKAIHLTGSILTAAVLLCAAPAGAQSMRCGGYLVRNGDGKAEILQNCGEPVYRDAFCKPLPNAAARAAAQDGSVITPACENVEEWTYNPGYGQFMTILLFTEGQVRAIRYGNRVR
ncbi:hypothetical protein LMG31506_02884 [Cupriavidus yeoncheonensis]|uniref:DUF2845 domain-containing protein n=1 Tax=Cupriavidus yeoncheonensis TaxID=1462994 RepID=A0A916IUM0_9BURK|nr:DUF2845 domain-containing protein [Cupriavidus yeoncheonensis]CAG2143703.1 hypothetical protein LMG31506_02884 [Cupriavidus yeoncheonensis]